MSAPTRELPRMLAHYRETIAPALQSEFADLARLRLLVGHPGRRPVLRELDHRLQAERARRDLVVRGVRSQRDTAVPSFLLEQILEAVDRGARQAQFERGAVAVERDAARANQLVHQRDASQLAAWIGNPEDDGIVGDERWSGDGCRHG